MKKHIGMVCCCVLCAVFGAGSLFGEYVFMKDGSIRKGTIISESSSSVVLQTAEKKREVIRRRNIMRLLYTELYMGRVYVQKADGKGIVGYMVDEDRKTYTFRKELYRPEEFKLKRNEVLFIARRNPSGLLGEAETDCIRLKWMAPYNQVEAYKIYLKGPGDPKFRVVDDTGSRRYTVDDLKSNTEYTLHVTAVAREGDESLPSNEITVKTKNIKPEAPCNIILCEEQDSTHTGNNMRKVLTWEPACDPDGRVEKYRVYCVHEGATRLLSTITDTRYEVPENVMPEEILVSAVDDVGDASPRAGLNSLMGIGFSLNGVFMTTLGDFGEQYNNGTGAIARISMKGIFADSLVAGIESGYLYFFGHDELYDHASLVPAAAFIGWRFSIGDSLAVVPRIGGGYVYARTETYKTILEKNEGIVQSRSAHEGILVGGIDVVYEWSGNFGITAGTSWYGIPEEKSLVSFMVWSAGLMYSM